MRRLRWLSLAALLAAVGAGIAARAGAGPSPLTVPADITAEAEDPAGARVTFAVTGADPTTGEALPVACDHPAGAAGSGTVELTDTFPLGLTTVMCTATSSDTQVSASFLVTVVDSTPPRFAALPAVAAEAQGPPGAVVAYAVPAAVDSVDGVVPANCDPPPGSTFPIGETIVTCIARDAHGNIALGSFGVTVAEQAPTAVPPPSTVTARPPAPPENVRELRAIAADGLVRLSWVNPDNADFDHVRVLRSQGSAPRATVYEGKATSVVDRRVRNGVAYRYEVVSVDLAGNVSTGAAVVAKPARALLTAPEDGAKVAGRPLLAWRPTPAARYYNLQLFRGRTKILSIWPSTTRVRLERKWLYGRRWQRLIRGSYRWYVWPGFGSRSARRYGRLLGTRTFELVG